MFRVGETYQAANGNSVLVIANDAPMYNGGTTHCPVIGLTTTKGAAKATSIQFFDKKGWYAGLDPKVQTTYAPYRIQSDEPNEEELKMIADLRAVIRDGAEDDIALTKLLRQLKK